MVLSRDQKSKDGFVFIYKIFDLRTFPHVLHVAVYFQIASVLTHIKHIVLNITTKRSCSLFTLSFLPSFYVSITNIISHSLIQY